ncbi:beta-ketoacyl synthase N-terminal-like domain-containing protein, partial [Salinicoccus roseus]|uniref:beta-ketoacyl synthase N-terminal-like domain-containing protein n=1 Tax=Salinicoccus roseus TaxID=45670 RepID=UPI00356135C3
MPLRRVKAEEESVPATSENQDAIAIVGISGRYPGAEDVEQYWKNLAQGQN